MLEEKEVLRSLWWIYIIWRRNILKIHNLLSTEKVTFNMSAVQQSTLIASITWNSVVFFHVDTSFCYPQFRWDCGAQSQWNSCWFSLASYNEQFTQTPQPSSSAFVKQWVTRDREFWSGLEPKRLPKLSRAWRCASREKINHLCSGTIGFFTQDPWSWEGRESWPSSITWIPTRLYLIIMVPVRNLWWDPVEGRGNYLPGERTGDGNKGTALWCS